MQTKLLNINELAEYLGGVSKLTIYDWVNHKKIPYTKVGRCLRFPKQIIDDWLGGNTYIPLDLKKKNNYNSATVRGEDPK